jgi:flagellar biosynthesis protein FlhB
MTRHGAPGLHGAPDRDELLTALAVVHLQWFAAEDEGRTEEPTEHKIRKAREEGKVAKSQDVSSSVVLLFTVIALLIIGRYMLMTSLEMLSYFLTRSTEVDVATDRSVLPAFYSYFIRITLPIALVAFVAAIMGNVIQVGFLFTTKTITPDLTRVAPRFMKFVQRAIFSTEALFNLGKSLAKVVIIVGLGVLNVAFRINEIVATLGAPLLQSFSLVSEIAFNLLIQSAIVLLALSALDYLFQRRQHRESLKMTRQEVKEERRTFEGDPLIKSRMRQRMNELLRRNMLQNVPRADVVVTNPTHFAVAMEYDRFTMDAPTVIAKGQDNVALKIREIAAEAGVPIIENKPLARALFTEVEIGDTIPQKFYEAVVIVLKQMYQMTGRAVGGLRG